MSQPLEISTVLRDRYQILELIGKGGMGAVYKAEDLRLRGRFCAVKEVLPELPGMPGLDEQAHEQFYREASTLARLDHPNLPKVSDYFAQDGREYLVMDFVPGRDLREMVDEARRTEIFLAEDAVLGWAAQLCDALTYLHTQEPPVLHRDIKPSNIKLTPRGIVKLVDFGLVKLLQPDDSRTVTVVQGRGTVAYTPLEQYGGDTGHTDIRSDIYALGSTLYHLLGGQPPADAKQRFLRPGTLIPLRDLNSRVSVRTERAIMAAMAQHPDDRPATIEDLREMIFPTGVLSDSPLGNLALTPAQRVAWSEAMLSNRWLIGATLLLAALALLVSIWSPSLPLSSPVDTPVSAFQGMP